MSVPANLLNKLDKSHFCIFYRPEMHWSSRIQYGRDESHAYKLKISRIKALVLTPHCGYPVFTACWTCYRTRGGLRVCTAVTDCCCLRLNKHPVEIRSVCHYQNNAAIKRLLFRIYKWILLYIVLQHNCVHWLHLSGVLIICCCVAVCWIS